MKWPIFTAMIICSGLAGWLPAQQSWDDLPRWIAKAEVVSEARIYSIVRTPKARHILCDVLEIFKGPQRLNKFKIEYPLQQPLPPGLSRNKAGVFFLVRQGHNYRALHILKSHLFLTPRVRKLALKERLARSDLVVLAQVQDVQETPHEDHPERLEVQLQCVSGVIFKGKVGKKFVAHYQRIKRQQPPHVIIFKNLEYIFFLKRSGKKLLLINPYEGAYSQTGRLAKAIGQVLEKPYYVRAAGKPLNGLLALAKASKEVYHVGEPVEVFLLIQNVSRGSNANIEMYLNDTPFFTLFHITNAQGQIIKLKYPRKSEVPPIEKRYYSLIKHGDYFYTPFDLAEYGLTTPGEYFIHIEFHLPWEYGGKAFGKNGWSGRVVSNQIKIVIAR